LESNLKHVQTDSTPNLIWNLAAAAMALQRQAMAMAKKKDSECSEGFTVVSLI
jgi:hypothetical protein